MTTEDRKLIEYDMFKYREAYPSENPLSTKSQSPLRTPAFCEIYGYTIIEYPLSRGRIDTKLSLQEEDLIIFQGLVESPEKVHTKAAGLVQFITHMTRCYPASMYWKCVLPRAQRELKVVEQSKCPPTSATTHEIDILESTHNVGQSHRVYSMNFTVQTRFTECYERIRVLKETITALDSIENITRTHIINELTAIQTLMVNNPKE